MLWKCAADLLRCELIPNSGADKGHEYCIATQNNDMPAAELELLDDVADLLKAVRVARLAVLPDCVRDHEERRPLEQHDLHVSRPSHACMRYTERRQDTVDHLVRIQNACKVVKLEL